MRRRPNDRSSLFGESVSAEEAEAADSFWEDLVGETSRRRHLSSGAIHNSRLQRLTKSCLSPSRPADFRNNVAPTTAFPRMEICKLFVTRRSGAIPGAPVVDPDGQIKEDPNSNDGGEPGSGAGGLSPGAARPYVTGLVHSMGTGFFIGPDRIATAAHVVLDALEVIVVPGKMGRRSMGTGSSTGPGPGVDPSEPFGRFTVTPAQIAIHPPAIAAATSATATADNFFAEDLAVIRNFSWPHRPHTFGSAYRLGGPPSLTKCVHTCGYSAQTVDPDFQHCDTGFHHPLLPTPFPAAPLVEFNLLTERGASGSPIWEGPRPRTTGSGSAPRRVIGVAVMGRSTLHTGSPLLNAARRTWLRTA